MRSQNSNPKNPMVASVQSSKPMAIAIFDIDGVVRDVAGSYRRALADTVEQFTQGQYRPTPEDIDTLKAEGCWNNDWEASQELIQRFFQAHHPAVLAQMPDYQTIVQFFQSKYRGENFSGYIQSEPLLMSAEYLDHLTRNRIPYGFFSGATRGSAQYILERRLGLEHPTLIAMEDAPGKPNPAGLFQTLERLAQRHAFDWEPTLSLGIPILYVGDTVADMQTAVQAQHLYPAQQWIAVGVIPPHVQQRSPYRQLLEQQGAIAVLNNVESMTADWITHTIYPASNLGQV